MTHNRRLIIWIAVTVAVILGITIKAYSDSKQDIDSEEIFQNKTEEQIKMELLEIQNYKYEEKAIATVETADYQFDIFRVQEKKLTNNYGFYVVGTNLTKITGEDGKEYFAVGPVDFQICPVETDGSLGSPLSNERLKQIAGTNIMVGYIDFINDDEASDYVLILDSENAEDFGLSEYAKISLNDINVDTTSVIDAASFRDNVSVKDGFENDLKAAGYAKVNWQTVISTFIFSTIGIGFVSGVSYITIDREIINKRKYKK